MFEFIFCTATPLSDRYKKSIVRRLKKSSRFPILSEDYTSATVLIGDWTLYHDKALPKLILDRDKVKAILGCKRLKEW